MEQLEHRISAPNAIGTRAGIALAVTTPLDICPPVIKPEPVPKAATIPLETSTLYDGAVVPMPTLPLANMVKSWAFVVEATAKRVEVAEVAAGVETESGKAGVVVPIPTVV